MPTPARVRADACPGVFAPHDAADGPLARVRLPGGTISAVQLHALADAAEACGDGDLHLTSRGNVQLRGVTRPGLAARLTDAGLLPSPSHERVRNVLASPLSGVSGGLADVRGLAASLDLVLCSTPELAALPGRFLFAFDDGRGDVASEGADVCWRATGSSEGTLLLAGGDTGRRVARADVVAVLIEVALEFCRVRGAAWRVAELDDPAWRGTPVPRTGFSMPAGLIPQDGGGYAAGVVPRFGQLSATQARALAEFGTALVTPWKSLVLPDVPPDVFARLGFGGEALGTTACIGRPGCAKSRADVRADAVFRPGLRAHFSGCERRCGKPSQSYVDVVAEAGGYRIDGRWVPLDEMEGKL
ncbi:precorrin-3B synthase [Amycolatopsis mediterranei S699]|uniref:Precorrin-3B synthase n=1 Tax=Amycolatopsis mediterranei (strain U-32) TaxID=749927 RepID=A0A0H3DDM4_AMYMU|nr:nitrite/sulfite reductase [Amycolatopsis mediterranei]ADJ48781.1 precorrin-3B synthase [Amycolatopsis mediterranei U32]AFO80490.1 precorrin-3B synthase [Amycolatopsis mediterranei S699]AGT87618.1 precorrin-3B synthase [Amycolatopsis mediterranei RB]KDO03998.1 precorrin-3B synthase [Amycolatopsis mediterranei]KDU94111.1 precorrin-3B synthase [Amycolatopsis mediterranei]